MLIPKPGRDLSQPDSWRPINLLPPCFKVLSKIIAVQVDRAIRNADQWSLTQRGARRFVAGCQEGLFLVRSALESHRKRHTPLYMAFLHLKNAFGSVSIPTILKVIELGRADPLTRTLWEQTVMDNHIHVRGRGCLSARAHVRHGIAQGNTISPITNIVFADTSNKWVEKKILGAPVFGIQCPGVAFVDDTLGMTDNEAEFKKLLAIVIYDKWATYANIVYNPRKSAMMAAHFANGRKVVPRVRWKLQGHSYENSTADFQYPYFGIKLGYDRLCGSGPTLPRVCNAPLQRMRSSQVDKLLRLKRLHPVNAIQLLDDTIRSIAVYLIQKVELPDGQFQLIDDLVLSTACKILGMGDKEGARVFTLPPALRGIRLKPFTDMAQEMLLKNVYRLK